MEELSTNSETKKRERLLQLGTEEVRQLFKQEPEGRPWDEPHTNVVMKLALELIDDAYINGRLDAKTIPVEDSKAIIGIVALFHDIGYKGLLSKEEATSDKAVKEVKDIHNIRSVGYADLFLRSSQEVHDLLTDQQRMTILNLIYWHDQVERLPEKAGPLGLIFMEADTLAALSVDEVEPTYSVEDSIAYLTRMPKRRFTLFITPRGQELFYTLLEKYKAYYRNKAVAEGRLDLASNPALAPAIPYKFPSTLEGLKDLQ